MAVSSRPNSPDLRVATTLRMDLTVGVSSLLLDVEKFMGLPYDIGGSGRSKITARRSRDCCLLLLLDCRSCQSAWSPAGFWNSAYFLEGR